MSFVTRLRIELTMAEMAFGKGDLPRVDCHMDNLSGACAFFAEVKTGLNRREGLLFHRELIQRVAQIYPTIPAGLFVFILSQYALYEGILLKPKTGFMEIPRLQNYFNRLLAKTLRREDGWRVTEDEDPGELPIVELRPSAIKSRFYAITGGQRQPESKPPRHFAGFLYRCNQTPH